MAVEAPSLGIWAALRFQVLAAKRAQGGRKDVFSFMSIENVGGRWRSTAISMVKKNKGSSLMRNESAFYAQVRAVIVEARRYVHKTANVAMVKAYWLVGKMIVEQQGGAAKAAYGDGLIDALAERLTAEFGTGFTRSNLRNMRQFYLCFENCHTLCGELSWSHYRKGHGK